MKILRDSGVLASEMECSMLFTLGAVFNQQLKSAKLENTKGQPHGSYRFGPEDQFLTGAVLAVIGDDSAFSDDILVAETVDNAVKAGIETVKQLAVSEMGL